jgi:hypothetical protein
MSELSYIQKRWPEQRQRLTLLNALASILTHKICLPVPFHLLFTHEPTSRRCEVLHTGSEVTHVIHKR